MIKNKRVLTKEEVEELYYKMKNGDKEARSKLIEGNIRLVMYIANNFASSMVEIEDLISCGFIGLIKAVDSYDINKKALLSYYVAKCVRNEMLMFLAKSVNHSKKIERDSYVRINSDGQEYGILESLTLKNEDDNFEQYMDKQKRELITEMLSELTDEERLIIILRYGFLDDRKVTQKEIAQILGVDRSLISKREVKILQKLRKSPIAKQLKEIDA